MAILVNDRSRIIIQGITGHNGRNMAGRMLEGGTALTGGVTPNRGGERLLGLPVFDSCHAAVASTGANASFVSVPAPFTLEACQEAVDAGIRVLVVYTEGVPIADAIAAGALARAHGAVLLGPNAAGCVSPGLANLSDINDVNLEAGHIGVVSKSGTLACEVVDALRANGMGESTVVCLGGDAVTATGYRDVLELFERDPETDMVVLVGEIGGRSELIAADYIREMSKPVVAYIAGRHAPPGRRMGHAGALLGSAKESAESKIAALAAAGAVTESNLTRIGGTCREVARDNSARRRR